ncbi:hypothetical protein LELG_03446 [Lodderomyces elongisporus NRRL YB-4239]|uniref:Uncharacterized protein n=2 Tax=Lodderomyces elongisporus TaxID=36914 RepID=A5E1F9_LODEL|nr:hypothetical protein LELG_03446 [Lodderomyces elongisporus NRRL YB-4239]
MADLPFTIRYKLDHAKLKPAAFNGSPSYIIYVPRANAPPKKAHVVRVGLAKLKLCCKAYEEPDVPLLGTAGNGRDFTRALSKRARESTAEGIGDVERLSSLCTIDGWEGDDVVAGALVLILKKLDLNNNGNNTNNNNNNNNDDDNNINIIWNLVQFG